MKSLTQRAQDLVQEGKSLVQVAEIMRIPLERAYAAAGPETRSGLCDWCGDDLGVEREIHRVCRAASGMGHTIPLFMLEVVEVPRAFRAAGLLALRTKRAEAE